MAEDATFPLEPDGAALRERMDQVMGRLLPYLETLPDQPAARMGGGEALARSLREDAPERGTSLTALLDILFERAIPEGLNTASPGYLAYIPGGGLPDAALGEFLAAMINRYVGVWVGAPGLVQLETNVLRWFCALFGLPRGSGGLLTTGGSLANLIGLVTARRECLGEDFSTGVLYVSDQAHHSIRKAAVLAGFPARNLRAIPSDANYRLRLDALAERVAADRAAGLRPFLLVANAGTTNTGAVDPLPECADYCAREKLWLHVDAAYGGFFQLTARGRARLRGIERADSLVVDPHKGLFLPYGTGCLLVREQEALRRAHHGAADYMPPFQRDPDFVDFCELSPELSRDFRGLRLWLPLRLHGLGAFREQLDEKLDLTELAYEELRGLPQVEILAPPQLSVFAFRLHPPGLDPAALDSLNRRFLAAINARGRIHLTATMLRGVFALRICVLHFRTHEGRLREGIEDLRAARAEVLAGP